MDKPLEGVQIIDLSTHGACPSCGKILADWGAFVIKVEALSGDAARHSGQNFGVPCTEDVNPHFDMLNAGKHSLAVDMKTTAGKEIMSRLLASSQALITNFRTPALIKLGLDHETISKRYPHLVWGHLTGFGEAGPAADHAGFDTVAYYARTGAMLDFTENGASPLNAPFGAGDLSAGSAFAGGIVAGLYRQAKTGQGQRVSISLYGQSIWAHGVVLQSVYHGNSYPRTRKAASVPLNNCYRCSDGQWIYLSVLQYERYYSAFCRIIGREELIDDPRFNSLEQAKLHNRELIGIIDEAFAQRPRDEWDRLLTEADIAHDSINHIHDVFDDLQATENQYIRNITYEDGTSSVIASPPVLIGDMDREPPMKAPHLGEHTREILKKLHYTDDEIDSLYRSNAVK